MVDSLVVDFMIVQSIPFIYSISINFKFRTVESFSGKKNIQKGHTEHTEQGIEFLSDQNV